MLAGSGLAAFVRVAAWIVLVGSSGASAAGLTLPCGPVALAIALAAPIALFALGATLTSAWRGPPIISLVPEQAARCGPGDARLLRESAQLRGPMGGTGFVHRRRLVFPAAAWAAALLAGADGVAGCAFTPPGPWVFFLAVAAVVAAWLWPSRPYWYLEVDGGGALVTPPEAVAAINAARRGDVGEDVEAELDRAAAAPTDPARTTLRSLGLELPAPEDGPDEEPLDPLPGATVADEDAGTRRPRRA